MNSHTSHDGNIEEIIQNWKIILTCFVCLTFSIGPIVTYSFGILAPEIMKDMDWSRADTFKGFVAHNIGILIGAPLVGLVIDRVGAYRVILFSIPMLSLLWITLGFIQGNPIYFYIILALIPILAGGTLPMSYSRLIVRNFDKNRGLALGISLAGVGVGAALLPLVLRPLIDSFGWRDATFFVGITLLVITMPCAYFLLRNQHEIKVLPTIMEPVGSPLKAVDSSKPSRRQILQQPAFWLIAVFILLTGYALTSVLVNLSPIIIDAGISKSVAAILLSTMGGAIILGRLGIGFLLDKFFAPYVAAMVFIAPAIGFGLLATSSGVPVMLAGALLLGIAVGAEVDLMAYFVSRYFHATHFGLLNGALFSMFVASGAFGPLSMGYFRDTQGDYVLGLLFMSGLLLVSSVVIAFLPKYPDLNHTGSKPA